ncbi:MAG: methylated DNA-protein cysteine methyltransferase [Halorubrum sp. J07HR59]|jgi:Methylated DNA-protein cysteine methyltransferase|nr:MAG: methylated DNA-protein cysteine methyltransferase [Halorubrum sp. J07HR59]
MDTFAGASGVYARRFERLDRVVELGFASGRLIAVSFVDEPPSDADDEHPVLDRIGEYLAGQQEDFSDVEVAFTVGADERSALESLREVPYGESASVSQVVRMAARDPNDADDITLIKQGIAKNPTPLIVPDHRIQGSDGSTPPAIREILRDIEGI